MAHSCEIVTAIAANLVSDNAVASAVALARCSRSLEEPVLRKVWRNLDSLAPLVKCFPPEVWGIKDGKLFFERAPLCAEWTRFQQQYASKVRHLVVSSPDAVISQSALQLFQLYSYSSPLLPNLVSMDWTSDDVNLPFISPFISRSLTTIDIDVPETASRLLPPILMRLSTMSPRISRVIVQRLKYEPSMEEASSHLLMQCNPSRLRRYNVDTPLSAAALGRIIQLPLLEEFWLVRSFPFPDPLPKVVFPSLKLLDVEFDGDLTWLKLLPAIQSPSLSIILVQCPGPDVARFMETFQLTTTTCGMHERLQEFTVRSQANGFKITSQIIACNLSFKNLAHLEFLSTCTTSCQTANLTDDDIDLLTEAMPGLEALAIGQQPCSVPSKITFKSLCTISRRCTRLTTLQIHFNPRSFITKAIADSGSGFSDPETVPSPDLCSITKFDVGKIAFSPQSNASYIMALGLLGVFPRLEEVGYDNVAWKETDRLIQAYRHIRTAIVKG